jgi:hypothetical protein
MLLEHLFAGEIMRHMWLHGVVRLEILKPQVDDGGYDLVLEANEVIRHIQLKASFRGSTTSTFPINSALSQKPSGCIIVLRFEADTMQLGPFLWFGGPPGKPLPPLEKFKIAKHTKANAQGVKNERPGIRSVPMTRFERLSSIEEVATKLFGAMAL